MENDFSSGESEERVIFVHIKEEEMMGYNKRQYGEVSLEIWERR